MKKKLLFLLPALALLLGACQPSQPDDPVDPDTPVTPESQVESVTLDRTEANLNVGETISLIHTVSPYTVSQDVTWTSSDSAIASVNNSGRVRALSKGTATITATSVEDTTKSATCVITVNARQVSVEVETPDTTKEYTAAVYQGALKQWLYFSGEHIESGGSQRIKGDENKENAVPVKLEDAGDNQYYFSFTKGGLKKYLNYTVPGGKKTYSYEDAPATKWSWHSAGHTLTTMVDGKTHYLGTYNNYNTISGSVHEDNPLTGSNQYLLKFYEIVDAADPESVTITPESANIYAGASLQLKANIQPYNWYSEETLTWSVSGNDKVTISTDGLVTVAADAVIDSTATVTAKLGALQDTCTITVKEKLNYGTLQQPLTTEELVTLVNKLGLTNNQPSPEKVYVRTVVSSNEAWDTGYNNYKKVFFSNEDGTASKSYAYATAPATGVDLSAYTAQDSLKGATLTFYGNATTYNGTAQLAKGSQIVKAENLPTIGGGETPDTPDTPDTPEDVNWATPVNGQSYKFGYYQGNKSDYYYITGAMSGFYGATTQTYADAVDVTTTASGDDWVLSTVVGGATKYIELAVNGTYYNYVYTDTSSHTWDYDETLGAFVTVASDNTPIAIGTQGSGTFTTFSMVKNYSASDFLAHLYSADPEGTTPDTPDTPDTPATSTYGTLENPLTIAQVRELVKDYANNAVTPEVVYARGIVEETPSYADSYAKAFYLLDSEAEDTTDGNEGFMVYTASYRNGVARPAEHDTVVICGYIKNYNGTLEFTSYKADGTNNTYVYIESNTRGTSTVELNTAVENVTLSDLSVTSGVNGTTFTFKAIAAAGYQLSDVTVNGESVLSTNNNGTFTGTINGDTVVSATAVQEGVVIETLTISDIKALIKENIGSDPADATKYETIKLNEYITATATNTGNNSSKYYNSGNNWRFYQKDNPTLTLSIANGYEFVSVKITYASQNTGCLTYNSQNIASDQILEITGNSISYNVGNTGTADNGQARITGFQIVYKAA